MFLEIQSAIIADQGESTVTGSTFLGKEVLSIPAVGGWIRSVLNYKWVVIVMASLLVILGCIPKKARKEESENAAPQST